MAAGLPEQEHKIRPIFAECSGVIGLLLSGDIFM